MHGRFEFFCIRELAPGLELTSLAYQGVAITGAYWTVGGNETTLKVLSSLR